MSEPASSFPSSWEVHVQPGLAARVAPVAGVPAAVEAVAVLPDQAARAPPAEEERSAEAPAGDEQPSGEARPLRQWFGRVVGKAVSTSKHYGGKAALTVGSAALTVGGAVGGAALSVGKSVLIGHSRAGEDDDDYEGSPATDGEDGGAKASTYVPTAEDVAAIIAATGIGPNDKPTLALGGIPRAPERFLISSGGDVEAAIVAMRTTLQFRIDHRLDEEGCGCSAALLLKVAPYWMGTHCGATADGSPVSVYAFGSLAPRKLMLEVSEEELTAFYLHFMEDGLARQNKLNAAGTSSADWKGVVEVFDCRGIWPTQLYPPGLLLLRRVLSLATLHYPDNLRKAYCTNTPRAMWATWAAIKQVLHPQTVTKLHMMKGDGATAQLAELIGCPELLDVMSQRSGVLSAAAIAAAESAAAPASE